MKELLQLAMVTWQFFEESTGIQMPKTQRPDHHKAYDLQGRETTGSHSRHSIRIMDGRKTIE